MDTNPTHPHSKGQLVHNMQQMTFNMGPRPPPSWGVPPFPFPPRGPCVWSPYHSDLRYGNNFLRPPGTFSTPPPPLPTISCPRFKVVECDSADEVWAQSWAKSMCLNTKKEKPVSDRSDSISEAKQKLRKSVLELKKLRAWHDSLLANISKISEEEWKRRWLEIECSISSVHGMLNSLSKPESLLALKNSLSRRLKKRKRLKQRQARHRIEMYHRQIKRQHLHQQADAWLADMQLSVERARRDEDMKQEADIVLSEVTHRQSDGKRQIALLEALQKLHQARIQAVEAQTGTLSSDQKKQTNQTASLIDHLLNMWSKQMKEYSKEEHGLRVMLEESAAKQSDNEIQNVQDTLSQWEECLFGSENILESGEPEDLDMLVAARQAWDQYLVPDNAIVPMASTIPVGWVLPTTPSSYEWQKVLSQR